MKNYVIKRFLSIICSLAIVFSVFAIVPDATIKADANTGYLTKTPYTGEYSDVDGTYAGEDDLGRVLAKDYETQKTRDNRYVGIFYFLWQGEHGTAGPYDNTKIVANNPSALLSEQNWMAAGGGAAGAHHFWGEPLFGYYKSQDEWVMRKHLQMFVDTGIDFICFDTTNAFTYDHNVEKLINVWYEYLLQGYDVPKIVFYTNSASGTTMDRIYTNIYNNAELRTKYPRLDELWFYWEGKPLIIGVKSQASTAVKNYFRIKDSQWPNASKSNDGFPWMEFGRLNTNDAIYTYNGKSVMNVSVAQHNATCRFSSTAWYGGTDRTRSYVNGQNATYSKAYNYGHNFEEQWNFAINNDPDLVFVTGWNEWVAQRQNESTAGYSIPGEPIFFVDCADVNASRDVEPMRGYFGDNYYMQLVDYIRRYKGTDRRVNTGENVTIDVQGDMSQWESADITAKYTDYKNDTADRNCAGFGSLVYTDTTGRNDIISSKVTKDANNIYFYVETADTLTSYTDDSFMTLFIKNSESDLKDWYGYQYAVNYETPESDTKAYLSKIEPENGKWTVASTVDMKIDGNKLMVAIPRAEIEMTDELFDIEFKWADNYTKNDFWSFYENGDCAPYGRLNYVYSNCVLECTSSISPSSSAFTYKLDNLAVHKQTINFRGWAINNLYPAEDVHIHVYIGDRGYNLGATNVANDEVNAAFEASGTHGFNMSVKTNLTGQQTLRIFAVLENTNVLIYNNTINLNATTGSPTGFVDNFEVSSANTIRIRGWGYDADDTSKSIPVSIKINSVTYDLGVTDLVRNDVNNVFCINGNHGFDKYFVTDYVGEQTVEVYLGDTGTDPATLVTTKTVNVPGECVYYTDEDTVFDTVTYKYNDTLVSPGTPTKEGYIFTGWTYSHGGTTMPHSNITATANWQLLGDVNNDGVVSVTDATYIQMHLAHLITLSDEQLKLADVDKSGDVTINDAVYIQRYLAMKITSFEEINNRS